MGAGENLSGMETSPMLRCSRSMGEVEVRSTEGEGGREGREMAVYRPDHPHPRRLRRLDLSRFAGEVN